MVNKKILDLGCGGFVKQINYPVYEKSKFSFGTIEVSSGHFVVVASSIVQQIQFTFVEGTTEDVRQLKFSILEKLAKAQQENKKIRITLQIEEEE